MASDDKFFLSFHFVLFWIKLFVKAVSVEPVLSAESKRMLINSTQRSFGLKIDLIYSELNESANDCIQFEFNYLMTIKQ